MVAMVRKRGSHENLFSEKNFYNCSHHDTNNSGCQRPTSSPSSASSTPTANASMAITSCSGYQLQAEDLSPGTMVIDNGVPTMVTSSTYLTWV